MRGTYSIIFRTLYVAFALIFTMKTIKILETYTVKEGDSLWTIAQKYQVGLSELISANPQLANPALIYAGQKIRIPEGPEFGEIEKAIIKLVNDEREKYGLSPLSENWEISRVARFKSQDMADNNYFAHQSLNYGSPFQMLKDFGISFSTAAENIAYGQRNAQEVMNSWLNSAGHRANILNPNFNKIGVGVAKKGNGPLYFTQMFTD